MPSISAFIGCSRLPGLLFLLLILLFILLLHVGEQHQRSPREQTGSVSAHRGAFIPAGNPPRPPPVPSGCRQWPVVPGQCQSRAGLVGPGTYPPGIGDIPWHWGHPMASGTFPGTGDPSLALGTPHSIRDPPWHRGHSLASGIPSPCPPTPGGCGGTWLSPARGCPLHVAVPADLDKLLSDLRSFLLLLDRESLSSAARAKERSVWELLARLQSPPGPSEDAEYMIMRCLSPSPGTPQGRSSPGSGTADAAGGRACERRPGSALSPHGGNKVPGAPPTPPAEDSYEDAEPPGHGRTGDGDSDSSHYESYGEEEEEEEEGVTDRAHYLRWPSAPSAEAEPPGRPEAQLCGFLWRKRWLGQWAKQLFIVRHVLLCFRCAADLQPVLELDLRGCRVTCKDKRGKKMPHALKVAAATGEVLVIGFQSRQQAEDWRKVIEEVSSDAPSGLAALSAPASPPSRLSRSGKEEEEEEEENGTRQSPAHSPRPGEDTKGGFLAVRLRGRWQRLWCAVRHGALRMFPEPGAAQRPVCALRLDGCQVSPGAATGSPQNLRIRIAQHGRELALLQARSDEEREAWLKTLQARGGAEPRKGDGPPPRPPLPSSRPAAGGLLLRRVPTPNAYMDDPFGQPPPAETPKPLYSNAERLQQLQSLDRAVQGQRRRPASAVPTCASGPAPGTARAPRAGPPAALRARPASAQLPQDSPGLPSRDFSRSQHTLPPPGRRGTRDGLDVLIGKKAFPKLEEKVGQLESRVKGRLRAGSEMNLLALGRSLKGHIAATAGSAGSEGSFLRPLLKRTASARSALRPPPSPLIAARGNVMRKTKEWEMKSAM
ncbi:actin filament-associated protein 1-like isoform X2 [Prinia subflava]|uniref:actin filament-associated protein 1-like isoform X2 n=1 Tax=Prinia subflava TaxID=208062 RepID=UPI002FDFA4FA